MIQAEQTDMKFSCYSTGRIILSKYHSDNTFVELVFSHNPKAYCGEQDGWGTWEKVVMPVVRLLMSSTC